MRTANVIPQLLCFGLLTGCVSSGTQVQQSSLNQFQKGVTTQQQVEKALGNPQTRGTDTDGTHMIGYMYTHAHAKAASYVPIVGLFAGGAKGSTSFVTFRFDANDKLVDYRSNSSDVDVRTGIGAVAEQPHNP